MEKINKRGFLTRLGAGAALAMTACDATQNPNNADSKNAQLPNGPMETRTSATGDKVSLLGFGCMRWPTDDNGEIDQEMVNRLVDKAIESGVNYFDTSPAYCKGLSERATGIALARHPRHKYLIATKLSNFAEQTWSRSESMKIYNNSFKELQTDYIDYMLLHAIGMGGMQNLNKRYIDNGMLDFLVEERHKGKIRNLGFSYHGDVAVFDNMLALHDQGKIHWDFVQIQLNYLDWHFAKQIDPRNTNAEYLYNELEKRKIPAIIMEPLLGGRLAKVNSHIAARLKEREPNRSIASWAFRYAGSFPGVLTVLSGMTYMEHLNDNLASYSPFQPLSPDDMSFLDDVAQEIMSLNTIPCNDCKYCMPCPYGLDIPANLLHYNKCINEGYFPIEKDADSPIDTAREAYAQNRRAFLISYDRAVPKQRQATFCIGCKLCVTHCPQQIDIPRELQRIDRLVEKLRRQVNTPIFVQDNHRQHGHRSGARKKQH